MSYYFKIKIMLPEEDEQHFSERNLSKSELSEVTLYLQQKTSQGVPVKFRVSIFNAKEENKIMSVTVNTKNLTEIDVVSVLLDRVTDKDVLIYLNEKNETIDKKINENEIQPTKTIIETEKTEELPKIAPIETRDNDQKSKNKKKAEKKSMKFIILTAILAIFILISIGGVFLQKVQITSIKRDNAQLSKEIKSVNQKQTDQNKIDTFSRYFLAYYFTQEKNQENYQSNLKPYISSKLNISGWEALGKTLKTLNFYESQQTKKGYKITYIVNVLVDDRSKLQKIIFEVKPSKYSFVVISKPTITDFSFD